MGHRDTISPSVHCRVQAAHWLHIDQLHLLEKEQKSQKLWRSKFCNWISNSFQRFKRRSLRDAYDTLRSLRNRRQELRSVDVDLSGNILRAIYQWLLLTTDIPSAGIVYAAICLRIRAMNGQWCANTHSCKQDFFYFQLQPLLLNPVKFLGVLLTLL